MAPKFSVARRNDVAEVKLEGVNSSLADLPCQVLKELAFSSEVVVRFPDRIVYVRKAELEKLVELKCK